MPSNEVLNYVGVVLALTSTVFYVFVKTDVSSHKQKTDIVFNSEQGMKSTNNEGNESFFDRLSLTQKRVVGILLAFFSGLMYGECNTPTLYTRQENESKNLLDYMFSYYTGILMTSLLYFIIYCIAKKNKPVLYNAIILPGLISGLKSYHILTSRKRVKMKFLKLLTIEGWMWGCANICYFMATGVLSQAISFPIMNCLPQIVSTLWGVLVYKEIKGKRNFIFLFFGFAVATTASVLIGLSF